MLHTVISAASLLRDETCKARAARGLYAAQHDAAVCTLYWSDTLYSSEHLPAASRSRAPTSVLLLLHHALADAQHLLDLEARHRLLRRTRPSSSPRSQPRVVLASRGVLALRGRAAGTARALAHGHSTATAQRAAREPRLPWQTSQFGSIWTDDDGTCGHNLFLRSRICSTDPGIFAQP